MRIGIDIGGTFTDFVAIDDSGSVWLHKIPSTPEDYGLAIEQGLRSLFAVANVKGSDVRDIVHGTTVAANAILSGTHARTGLITTQGFRDVLEIGRLRTPRLYDLDWEKPTPVVPRRRRVVVRERIRADGSIDTPLDPQSLADAIEVLKEQKVESIAVCLLNAYANPDHERHVEASLSALQDVDVTLSHQVLPEIREFERTSTTVVNAAVMPPVRKYLTGLTRRLTGLEVEAPVRIMQSGGGITDTDTAAAFPVRIIESGPAAGVVAADALGRRIGVTDLIAFDMGGTTAKASLIEEGSLSRASDFEVGGGVSHSTRLMSGAGYHIRTPCIDLSEVGAGGGSIIRVDAGGALQVGPESAGADPGPVCYGRGGELPTITDACLVLGYLGKDGLAKGTVSLDPDAARAAVDTQIVANSDLSAEEACHGACRVAAGRMVRAVRAVTAERGRDPRAYDLLAAGGSGPMHAAVMARELGVSRIIVPPSPGVFSAFGLLAAPLQIDLVQTMLVRLEEIATEDLQRIVQDLTEQARERLPEATIDATGDIRYAGQSHELQIALPLDASPNTLRAMFEEEHERTYGHRSEKDPVDLVCLRVRATIKSEEVFGKASGEDATEIRSRPAYFGPEAGWVETPVINRPALGVENTDGPMIVEEDDATTVVPPWAAVHRDPQGNIIITL